MKKFDEVGADRRGSDRRSGSSMEHRTRSSAVGRPATDRKRTNSEGHRQSTKKQCPQLGEDYFGVRSYLRYFYEPDQHKSTSSTNCKYNWHTKSPQGQCSGVYWWKTMAMFGAGCLVIGIVTIIAGFLTPPRPIVVGPEVDTSGRPLRKDDAAAFDFKLEICRMIGLTMFCAGGLILAVSLMVPTFFYRSYPSPLDAVADEATQPVIMDDDVSDSDREEAEPLPFKCAVPATETTEVQPALNARESTLIGDSLTPYND